MTYQDFGSTGPQGFVPHQDQGQRPAATVLTGFAVLRIAGPDSERLLQGQLTCDVTTLSEDEWVPGACCTAKGRMVANFIIIRQGDSFLLRLPAEQLPSLKAHLGKYAVFYKTELNDAGLIVLGQAGLDVRERSVSHQGDDLVLTWPDGRKERWTQSDDAIKEWLSGPLMPEAEWHGQDIASGWAWVVPASEDAWIPQYIGWSDQGGISFTKGCYTGQEVVARLQYLGKSKRHLYRVLADAPLPEVMTAVTRDSKNIGELAAVSGNTGLAVLSADDKECEAETHGIRLRLEKVFYNTEEHTR